MQIKKTIPDWLIGVVLTVLFMISVYVGAFNTLELKTFDWRARLAASQTKNPDIEIVAEHRTVFIFGLGLAGFFFYRKKT